jgi:hypothetical protein
MESLQPLKANEYALYVKDLSKYTWPTLNNTRKKLGVFNYYAHVGQLKDELMKESLCDLAPMNTPCLDFPFLTIQLDEP